MTVIIDPVFVLFFGFGADRSRLRRSRNQRPQMGGPVSKIRTDSDSFAQPIERKRYFYPVRDDATLPTARM
jgi:hypothetical protein